MDAQQVKASMRLYHAVKAETHSVLEKPAEKTKSFKAAVSGDKQVEDNVRRQQEYKDCRKRIVFTPTIRLTVLTILLLLR